MSPSSIVFLVLIVYIMVESISFFREHDLQEYNPDTQLEYFLALGIAILILIMLFHASRLTYNLL